MNIKSVMSFLKTREGSRAAIAAVLLVLLVALFYLCVVRTMGNRRADTAERLRFLRVKVARYKTMADLIPQLTQASNRLQGIIRAEQFNFIAEPTEQSAVDILGRIFSQSSVRLSRMASIPDKPFSWDISFTADYPQIHRIFGLLENYCRLETVEIARGASGEHTVDLTATILLRPEDVRSLRNRSDAEQDLFDVFDRVVVLLKAMEDRRAAMGAAAAVSTDPLARQKAPEPEKPVIKREPEVKAPEITIGGILWDPEKPLAIINGKTMHVGDLIGEAVITEIRESGLTLRVKSRSFTINMNKRS